MRTGADMMGPTARLARSRLPLAITIVVTLLTGITAIVFPTPPASAHGYCETHEVIQVGMKAASDLTQTRPIDGVWGRVQVPWYRDIQSNPNRQSMGDLGVSDGYFTAAMIYLDNFKPSNDWTSDEVSVGWYMGIPNDRVDHQCCGPGTNHGMEWRDTPHWFLREAVDGTYGREYKYTAFSHPGVGGTGPIPMNQYHLVVLKRRNSSFTSTTRGIYDVYINGSWAAATSTIHQVGLMPGARGEVHGYPCVEMWSVWRENATGTAAATLRYHRHDYQQWYTMSHHHQRSFTRLIAPDAQHNYWWSHEGDWGHAGCFREQTLGHASTSYAYGPFDFDGAGGCMPPYVHQ